MVSSTDDTTKAAIAANAKAATKIFMVLPSNRFLSVASFGRHRSRGASRRRVTLGLFFLDPERVMFPRPVEIDLAGAHRIERAFHPDRADVDVRQHGGDEEHRDHGVDD